MFCTTQLASPAQNERPRVRNADTQLARSVVWGCPASTLAQPFSFKLFKKNGTEIHHVVVETGLGDPDCRGCSLSRSVKFLPSM